MNFKLAFFLLLSTALFALSASAKTSAPAGSLLESNSEVTIGGAHRSQSSVFVKVNQIYGLSLHPDDIQIKSSPGSPAYASCRLENLGNGTDKVTIHYNEVSKNLSIRLIVDENNDGIHQKRETKKVPAVLSLGENAVYYFFVEAVPSPSAKKGAWTWAGVTVTSSGRGGNEYTGYNGLRYGGQQKVSAMISAVVE